MLAVGFLFFNPLHLAGPWWITSIIALFFLALLLRLWRTYKEIQDRPVLTLSPEGVFHTSLGTGIVRWGEILLVEADAEASTVTLWLANRKEIPEEVPESRFARDGMVILNVENFSGSSSEILEAIKKRLIAANPACIAAKELALQARLSVQEAGQ
jgi:hypothetical protein